MTFLSRIIGQEEIRSKEVQEAQDKILCSIKQCISPSDALFLGSEIFAEECKKALYDMGLEKSPRWDGITVEFF